MPLMELLPGSHTGPAAGAMDSAHSGGLSGVGRERKRTVSTGGGIRMWSLTSCSSPKDVTTTLSIWT